MLFCTFGETGQQKHPENVGECIPPMQCRVRIVENWSLHSLVPYLKTQRIVAKQPTTRPVLQLALGVLSWSTKTSGFGGGDPTSNFGVGETVPGILNELFALFVPVNREPIDRWTTWSAWDTDSPLDGWCQNPPSWSFRTCQWGWCIRPNKKSHIFFLALSATCSWRLELRLMFGSFHAYLFLSNGLSTVLLFFFELEWAELRFCHGFPESGLPTCIILHWAIIRDDGTAEPVFEIHPETFEKRHEILKMQPFTFESYQPPLLNARPSIRLLFDPFKRKNTWQLVGLCRGCHLILEFFRWALESTTLLGANEAFKKGSVIGCRNDRTTCSWHGRQWA